MKTTHCFVCGAVVPDIEGPVSDQEYLPQSPGCWKLYTEVLEREYGVWQYPDVHRLTVDCYAAQHPTKEPNEKSAQSIVVHLAGIYLTIETDMPHASIPRILNVLVEAHKHTFIWSEPPAHLGSLTIADVHKARDLDEHTKLVTAWAHEVWNAWKDRQRYVRNLVTEHVRDAGLTGV